MARSREGFGYEDRGLGRFLGVSRRGVNAGDVNGMRRAGSLGV